MNKHTCKSILMALVLITSFRAIGQNSSPSSIRIEGEVLKPLTLTLDDLKKLKQAQIKTKDKDGNDRVFQGVPLVVLLESAGVTLGSALRGENLTKYILVKAADGYEVVFSLPEVDTEFTDQTVLLAYEADGKPLAKGEGPFRMIVPLDKKQARWIREIALISIMFSKD